MADPQSSQTVTVDHLRNDLADEQAALDRVVSTLSDDQWTLATSSAGWTVHDQIAHIAYFDSTARLAIKDPENFETHAAEFLTHASSSPDGMDRFTLTDLRVLSPTELLAHWREKRAEFETAAESLSDDDRVPWYGPSMGAKSFLTARLMETWAHGQDVADATGQPTAIAPTERLFHIARLGFNTRGWSYKNRKLEPPADPVSVSLASPGGSTWYLGQPTASTPDVEGSALDFCLVVTQRRHLDDTDLVVNSEPAREWLLIAQAFAGPPTQTAPN